MLARFIAPLTISGSLDKTDDCSDQYIKVSTQGSDSSYPWQTRPGFVTFVWNCNTRFIYGQSTSVSTSCPSEQTYDIEIKVEDSTVTFRDAAGVCGDLSLAETIGTSAFLYAYVGADADTGEGDAIWDSVEICSSATESPTGAPSLAPTELPTAAPTLVPTASPTGLPTGAPSPAPTVMPTVAPTANRELQISSRSASARTAN